MHEEVTGDHPVLTDQGWKLIEELLQGDKIACQDDLIGSYQYEEVASIELKKESREMFNLICDECAMIANGIVCGDFHVQYKMVFRNRRKKYKEE